MPINTSKKKLVGGLSMSNDAAFEKLYHRYIDDKCTLEEVRTLLQYFDVDENEDLLRSMISKQSMTRGDGLFVSDKKQQFLLKTIAERIKQSIVVEKESKPVVILINKRLWFRMRLQ